MRQSVRRHPHHLSIRAVALAAALLVSADGPQAAAVNWIGANHGYWDVAGNWNPAVLPGLSSDLTLNAFDTELRSGTVSINSLTGTGRLTLSGGSLAISALSSIGALTFSGGTLGGAGALNVTGAGSWTAGTMTGAGSTSFNGALALSGDGQRIVTSRNVNFAGTTTWTNSSANGGLIYTGSGATLSNSGLFQDQTSNSTQISNAYGGAASSFVNSGTYTKSGVATTNIGIGFNNSGSVKVNAGTLNLSGGGSSTGGSFDVASGATLYFGGGTHALNNITAGTGTGRMLVSGGTANSAGTLAFGGVIGTSSSGTLNANGVATAAGFEMTGGTVGGTGSLSIAGAGIWTEGTMTGAGSTSFNGALALSGDGQRIVTSRNVNFAGTTTWTNSSANGGLIYTGSAATLSNSGLFQDQTSNSTQISNAYGGAASSFVNSGTYTKSGVATTNIGIGFNNSGTLAVNAGTLSLTGGLINFSGTTLSGGAYEVAGSGVLQFNGANVVGNAASILLDGAGSVLRNASNSADALANFSSNQAAGNFQIRNGRNFTSAGNFANAGFISVGTASNFTAAGVFSNQAGARLQLAGGALSSSSALGNVGALTGFGSVSSAVNNSGNVLASGGLLALLAGVQGGSGAVATAAGASLNLGANSSAGVLDHQGVLLALGSSNITVGSDYNNAGFGAGNAFDRRAGVSGSGQILAATATQQTVSGSSVSGGSTALATLALPNSRVGFGGVSGSFVINNVGSGGASLRGALQNGGISNAALTGSGVTAQNWGLLAQGSSSSAFSISFNPLVGQALAGQSVQLVNNFDNVAAQSLGITGSAFNLASASAAAPSPVVLAAQRVGGTLMQALTLGNTAPASGYSERLTGSIAAGSGVLASGGFSLLAAGATSSALQVGVDTATSGIKSGQATITLASDGTGTSGFAAYGLGTQKVDVSGHVYGAAVAQLSTPTLNFGIVRVGDVVARNLSVSNTASGALTDTLRASVSGGGGAFALQGTAAAVLAGATDSSSLSVQLDTRTAGLYSGSGSVNFSSQNAEMADLDLGSSAVALAAQVNNLATVGLAKTGGSGSFSGGGARYTLNFGALTQGSSALFSNFSLFNSASGLADTLGGSFDVSAIQPGGAFTLTGLNSFAGLVAGEALTGLSVQFDSGVVGSFDRVIVLNALSSNASDPTGRALGGIELHLQGSVVAVPEPGTYLLMVGGLLLLAFVGRRRSAKSAF